MNKKDLNSYKQEARDYMDELNDPFYFEKYCGACDNFNTESCPFLDKVTELTIWKQEVKCDNFYD